MTRLLTSPNCDTGWLTTWYTNIGCSRNDVNFETSLKNVGALGFLLADVDAFDAEFVAISPIKEIWSKGRVGV